MSKTRTPMPSPRGTNRAGLFLSTTMAFDAAMIDAEDGPDGLVAEIKEALDGKMTPGELSQILRIIQRYLADDGQAEDDAELAALEATPDTPMVGGKMTGMDKLPVHLRRRVAQLALDAKHRAATSFERRYPNAARIKSAW